MRTPMNYQEEAKDGIYKASDTKIDHLLLFESERTPVKFKFNLWYSFNMEPMIDQSKLNVRASYFSLLYELTQKFVKQFDMDVEVVLDTNFDMKEWEKDENYRHRRSFEWEFEGKPIDPKSELYKVYNSLITYAYRDAFNFAIRHGKNGERLVLPAGGYDHKLYNLDQPR